MPCAKSAKGLFPILILLFLIVTWISTAKDTAKTGNCSRCRGWGFLTWFWLRPLPALQCCFSKMKVQQFQEKTIVSQKKKEMEEPQKLPRIALFCSAASCNCFSLELLQKTVGQENQNSWGTGWPFHGVTQHLWWGCNLLAPPADKFPSPVPTESLTSEGTFIPPGSVPFLFRSRHNLTVRGCLSAQVLLLHFFFLFPFLSLAFLTITHTCLKLARK